MARSKENKRQLLSSPQTSMNRVDRVSGSARYGVSEVFLVLWNCEQRLLLSN
jgi:hypothetical protein